MTAIGIIGIVLASAVGVFLLMGGVYALLEKNYEEKRQTIAAIIDYAAETYAETNQKLFQNIMKDAAEAVPNMIQGMYKTLEEEEEP